MIAFQRESLMAGLRSLPVSYYLKTGLFFMLNNVLLFLAVGMARKNEELIIVTLLNYTWPVMIYILRIPLFRLKISLKVFIPGVVLSLSGIALALLGDFDASQIRRLISARDDNVFAYLLAILTSVSWALYSNLIVKYKNQNDRAGIPVVLFLSGIVFLVIQAIHGELSTLKLSTVFRNRDLLYVILGPTSLGYLCWYVAMKNGNRILITALSFFIPILSFIFLHFRVGLEIGPAFRIAVILLISGSYLCYLAFRKSIAPGK
jgi:drug/metabolite transporter (DMT)-like permease